MSACDKCGTEVHPSNDATLLDRELGQRAAFSQPPRHLLPVEEKDGSPFCEGSPVRAQYLKGQPRDPRPGHAYDRELEAPYRAAYARLIKKHPLPEPSLAESYNIGPDQKHRLSIYGLEADGEEAGYIRVKARASHENGDKQEITFSVQTGDALFAGAGLKSLEEILGQKEASAELLLTDLNVYDDGHHRIRFDIAERSVAVWFKGREELNQKPGWM